MSRPDLAHARDLFEQRSWGDADAVFAALDRAQGLGPEDIEHYATAGYMLGRDEDFERRLERAHHAHLERHDAERAARCAVWVGISLALRGERGPASGWFGRASRLLEDAGDCVERGYLLVPPMMMHGEAGDYEASYELSTEVIDVAKRYGDDDLLVLSVHQQGRALLGLGRVEEGLALLDEAMVSVTADRLSPVVTGLVYCSVIEGCQEASEPRRAREWTEALSRWCDTQPDLVSFTGKCLLHRAEIMLLRGAFGEALAETAAARGRCAAVRNRRGVANAWYYDGELHRVLGDLASAEAAFVAAASDGFEPQPGLALLRLAQGDSAAAAAAIRRVLGESDDRLGRARLLRAAVEVLVADGALDEARALCDDVRGRLGNGETDFLRAMRLHAEGIVALAAGDAWAALVALRPAAAAYDELAIPYEVARVRELVGLACRAVDDRETADLELAAARSAYLQLGAALDLERVDAALGTARSPDTHGLTPRELEVLRLVARGETNRVIASTLVISEKTVARHVSNIFAKLGISTRAAATAFAYERQLV